MTKNFVLSCVIVLALLGCAGTQDVVVTPGPASERSAAVKKRQPNEGMDAVQRPDFKPQERRIDSAKLEEMPLIEMEDPRPNKGPSSETKPVKPDLNSIISKTEQPLERLYTITMRDSDIKSVLLSFSRSGTFNIVVDPMVTGTVTMDLKRVTLEEALKAILTPLGYRYRKEKGNITVYKPEMETRIFTLNYLTACRKGKVAVKCDTAGSAAEKQDATEVNTEQTNDVWAEMQNGIDKMLSKEGKAFVSKSASTLVVTDYPDRLDKVAEYLETVEGTTQRQVLIEASIIEVTLSDKYQMGLNWNQILGASLPQPNVFDPSGTDTILDRFGVHGSIGQSTFAGNTTPGSWQTGALAFSFSLGDLSGVLHALSAQGSTEIISKPRLTTLNNQTAVIKVGTEDSYFTQEVETSTVNQIIRYEIHFFTVGVVLDVTPQIGSGDEITMHIHPVITERTGEKTMPTGLGGDVTVPIVNIREASSVVRVKSGQTLIVAGLLLDKNKEQINGVPGLKNIPYLGGLFRYKSMEKVKTELIVALTPTIVSGRKGNDLAKDQFEEIFGTEKGRELGPRS
ncbi:MAG: secretin and TonB N-terminal domain-containing protein [Pseudomonadota bacterium]